MMLAPAIGPTLGGYLVTDIDWRMVFYVNVPVVTVALFMGVAWIQESVTTVVSFDYRGFLLAAVGFSSLLLGLSYGPSWGWTDHGIVGFLLLGVISLATWVVVELRERIPMLDLRMFKYRGYSLATGLNFVTTLGLFSSVFLLPLFLQNLRGLSAFGAGLMLMPQALGAMVSMPISGRLYDKFGPRIPVLVGFLLMGFTTLWLYNLDTTTPDAAFRLNLFIRGLGMGFAMMPIMTFGLASVPVRLISQASSITNVSRTVFGSLGVAVFASILDTFHKANLATLAQTLTPDSLTTMRFLSNIQIILQQSGASFEEARQVATYALYQLANLRAFVMAFDDAFLISAMIVFIGLLPVLFLTHHRTEKGERGPVVIA